MNKEEQLLKLANIKVFMAQGVAEFAIAEWDIHNGDDGGHLIPLWSLDPELQKELANEIQNRCFEQFQTFMQNINSWYNYYVKANQAAVDAQNALIKKLQIINLKGILRN